MWSIISGNHVSRAYIAGRKSYTIQGSKAQTLDWSDYGFMMYFPEDTKQHEDSCEVAVLALAGGKFQFPKGTELVSAVFSISFQKEINQPVGVHMEHCVAITTEWQATQLRFVATDKGHHSENVCVFYFIEGGQFQIRSKYGYMKQMHFCEIGITDGSSSTNNDSKKTLHTFMNNFLILTLYILQTKGTHWQIPIAFDFYSTRL